MAWARIHNRVQREDALFYIKLDSLPLFYSPAPELPLVFPMPRDDHIPFLIQAILRRAPGRDAFSPSHHAAARRSIRRRGAAGPTSRAHSSRAVLSTLQPLS